MLNVGSIYFLGARASAVRVVELAILLADVTGLATVELAETREHFIDSLVIRGRDAYTHEKRVHMWADRGC